MTLPRSRRFAASITGTALACAPFAFVTPAHADTVPWQLGFVAKTLVPSTDGTTLYAAALDPASGAVHVAAVNTSTGAVTQGTVTPAQATLSDSTPAGILDSVALDPSGKVEIGAEWPGATDPATSTTGPERYGVEAFDATTLASSGVVATSIAPRHLDLNGDGTLVLSDGGSLEVGTGAPVALPTSGTTTADVQQLAVRGGVVVVGGGQYDSTTSVSTPAMWTMPLTGTTAAQVAVPADFQTWNIAMAADGTAYVGEMKDNGPNANSTYQVQVVGGAANGSVIAVDDITHLALTHDGQSLYAGDQTVSLADPAHPMSVNWPQYGDVIAVGDGAVYATPQLSGSETTEPIVKLTPPAAAAGVSVTSSGDGTATVRFTAPAEASDDPAYVKYTVTAQPLVGGEPSGAAVTASSVSYDPTTSWYAEFNGSSLLTTGTTYSFSVRADNGAFVAAGTPVTHRVQPFIPGTGSVAITGSPTVGSTVTASVSGFQGDGITYTYEWDTIVVGGEWADVTPIAGATSATLPLTAALLGKKVGVTVTAHRDGFEPTTVWSQPVSVTAAPTGPGNGQGTEPTPQQVGSVTAPPVKAGSKKVTLVLDGVTTLPGKVKVFDGKKLLGTATVKNGKLVLKLHKSLGHGKHHLKLDYAGSAEASAFTKSVTLKVN